MKTVTYLWKHLSKSEKCALFNWKDNFVSIKTGISNQSPQAPVSSKWISNSTWQDVHQLASVCKIWAQFCALVEHIVCIYWMINTVHGLSKLVKYFIGKKKNCTYFIVLIALEIINKLFSREYLWGKLNLISCIVKPYAHFLPVPSDSTLDWIWILLWIQVTYSSFPSLSVLSLTFCQLLRKEYC